MLRRPVLVPALALLFVGGGTAQDAGLAKAPAPAASEVLSKAMARAVVHNKRVLAILADEGQDLAGSLKKDRTVSRPLLYEFETVQLLGKDADAMAGKWDFADAVAHKPALVVLDAGGKVLARLQAADFMADGKVAAKAMLAKLEPLYCAPVDAETKLAAGVAEAKKTGRAVFVRFDAPW